MLGTGNITATLPATGESGDSAASHACKEEEEGRRKVVTCHSRVFMMCVCAEGTNRIAAPSPTTNPFKLNLHSSLISAIVHKELLRPAAYQASVTAKCVTCHTSKPFATESCFFRQQVAESTLDLPKHH